MYSKKQLENKILNIDCLELIKNIPDNTIDLIITDPPYKVISGGNKKTFANGFGGSVLHKNNGKIFEHNDIKITDYINELYRILKEGSHFYIMVNNLNLEEFLRETRKAGFQLHNLLVWEKGNKVISRRYMKSMENILFLRKGPAKAINNKGDGQILKHPNPRNKIHFTEKPVSLRKQMIENSSNEGDLIFDPFAGAGGAGLAAKETGRKYLLSDLGTNFTRMSKMRIEEGYSRESIKELIDPNEYTFLDGKDEEYLATHKYKDINF